MLSWVYLVNYQRTNKYKIGVTNNIKRRLNELKKQDIADKIKLNYLISEQQSLTVFQIEKYYHKLFKPFRINFQFNTEWFSLPSDFEQKLIHNYYKNYLTFIDAYGIICGYDFNSNKLLFDEKLEQIDELSLRIIDYKGDLVLYDYGLENLTNQQRISMKIITKTIKERFGI